MQTPYVKMESPPFFGYLKILSVACAGMGFLLGLIYGMNLSFGITPVSFFQRVLYAFPYCAGSIIFLGVMYCFLRIVEAQIDTRNAIVWIAHNSPENNK